MISTRGRYALRVMLDLAEQNSDSFIPLEEIANRQGISKKYLESILKVLVQNDLLKGLRGKGGGYRLT
ncbi:MAG: Rrf2 family transcriptional regulator, partial [Selenomonadaceae bacterium]|nr:Rrf2 family transcriptional regulator [Selenomonadaceae bacterium]